MKISYIISKKITVVLVMIMVIGFVTVAPFHTSAATKKLPTYTEKQLYGKFIIQDQGHNRLWYVNPTTKRRYLIRNADDLNSVVKFTGMTVTKTILKNISSSKKTKTGLTHAGSFIYSELTQPWYIDKQGVKHSATNYDTLRAYAVKTALHVSDANLRLIAMNSDQITFDPLFSTISYVSYDGTAYSKGKNDDVILPLASLTKLMTALVLLDLNPQWDSMITVTKDEIQYPKTIVGDDATSEVDLRVGDTVHYSDLWMSMLLASSNQSAIILADNSGVSRERFISLMNEKARSLGLTKTEFHEIAGLNPNNISTAREMSQLAYAAFSNDSISNATNHTTYAFFTIESDGSLRIIHVANRNYSLLAFNPEASKTGYLVEAQRNAVLKKNGSIITVLHASSMIQRNEVITTLLK